MVHSIDISTTKWDLMRDESRYGNMVSIAAQRCDSFLTVYASNLVYPPSRSRRARKMSKLNPLMVNQAAVVFREADALVEDIPAALEYLKALSERGIRCYVPRFVFDEAEQSHWMDPWKNPGLRVNGIHMNGYLADALALMGLWEAIEAEMEVDRIQFAHVDKDRDADFLIREINTNILLD